MPTVDVIFLKAARWYCMAQWSDAFVAQERSHVKVSTQPLPHRAMDAHKYTTLPPWPPTTRTTAHILGRTWHSNKSVVTAGQSSWDLNACLVLIWTSSWNTVWWQRARFPLGRACSWRSTLYYLPLTFPSVAEVINKLHKGGGNWIPELQQSIVHACVCWWMPWFW